ncbi:hypothetical protein CDL15_Pgr023893 [Punica granatum]|uniref:Uncharacterized protein n=1 Tax=Punica granatum TaxID=22663 RepID=A0A218XVH6_PUNGR|nr:hypothetical protein CDL15_Pgr023893 [Punica granatum]
MWRVVADQRSLSEGRRNDRADGEVGEGEHVTVATLLLPSQGAYCRLKLVSRQSGPVKRRCRCSRGKQ